MLRASSVPTSTCLLGFPGMKSFGWLLAVAAICVAPRMAQAEPPASATVGALTPEKVKAALAELEKLTETTLKTAGIPGIAIVVVYRDEVVWMKGFGLREAGKPERIDADTVFQLASVSKPITSTVLAALVGEGKIGWDDAVDDHDPGFALFDPYVTRELTLRDLLCHRSGLPDHSGDLLEDMGYDRGQILHRLRFQPTKDTFRSHYAYTNYGYTEAAVAAALAVGKTWEDLAAEKLYRPLGMKATSSRYADFAKAKNRGLLHSKVGEKWVAKNTRQPDAQSPAGGVSSTLRDMSRWLRLQLGEGKFEGEQLVAAAALAETHSPQIVTGFDPKAGRLVSYGLGWNVSVERGGRVFWKHSGGFDLGMRTEVAMLPGEQIGLAVFCNSGPHGIPEAMTESFFDLLLDGKLHARLGRVCQPDVRRRGCQRAREPDRLQPAAGRAISPPALGGLCRHISQRFFWRDRTGRKGSIAGAAAGAERTPLRAAARMRDTFVYQPAGEMAGGPSGVFFAIGADGKATQVRIENLDVHGQGSFLRAADKGDSPAK